MSVTQRAAEVMLGNGWYTAARLGADLGMHPREVSGVLYSMQKSSKYQMEVTDLPNRKFKLIAIKGRKVTTQELWRIALFGQKAA